MRFVDSHAHLADPAFSADLKDVLLRAREAGVAGIVSIGESLAAAERASEIASANAGFVFWTAGVHPHDAASFDAASDIAAITEHLARGAVAIGECGLDYHYDHSPRERQRHAFASQLALAVEQRRPVVVHTREAEADTEAMVTEAGRAGVRGVLHCFTGPAHLAERAIEAGWYISFSGIVTFPKWSDTALVAMIPDDRLLIETDAPYLSPVPHRKRRNEPAFARETLQRVADFRGTTAAALAPLTIANANALFGLAIPVQGA